MISGIFCTRQTTQELAEMVREVVPGSRIEYAPEAVATQSPGHPRPRKRNSVTSAMGTAIASGLVAAYSLWRLWHGGWVISFPRGQGYAPDWGIIRSLFRFGLPAGIQGIAMNVGGLLPIPDINNKKFPEAKKHEDRGLHRILYRFSPNDYKEIVQIWNGPHP